MGGAGAVGTVLKVARGYREIVVSATDTGSSALTLSSILSLPNFLPSFLLLAARIRRLNQEIHLLTQVV